MTLYIKSSSLLSNDLIIKIFFKVPPYGFYFNTELDRHLLMLVLRQSVPRSFQSSVMMKWTLSHTLQNHLTAQALKSQIPLLIMHNLIPNSWEGSLR